MAKHEKTIRLMAMIKDVLADHHPMTVRQAYYQLVSRQVIKNSRSAYQTVSKALVEARLEGIVPWEWVEDRLRRPRKVAMWRDLTDFAETCRRSYRRDVWDSQPRYVEAWLEKDALSGIFEDVLDWYGMTLNVGRGYDGWDSIHNAARRYVGRDVTVLYFGDFDPSGEDMVRSLQERLDRLGVEPEIVKVALTMDDIERYNLPPNLTKKSDTRSAAFIARHGDVSVELDALPPDVLRGELTRALESHMDLEALEHVRRQEAAERKEIMRRLSHGS